MSDSKKIGEFYDKKYKEYRTVYGKSVQIFQLKKNNYSLERQFELLDFCENDLVIDAGCGECEPAIFFTKKITINIHGFTVSGVQYEVAKKK